MSYIKSYAFQAAEPRPEFRPSDYKLVPFQLRQKENQQGGCWADSSCQKAEFASSFWNGSDGSRWGRAAVFYQVIILCEQLPQNILHLPWRNYWESPYFHWHLRFCCDVVLEQGELALVFAPWYCSTSPNEVLGRISCLPSYQFLLIKKSKNPN